MIRVLVSIAISLFVEILLILLAIFIFKDWPSICFFIILLWPVIWITVGISMLPASERGQVDMIKMQTYFNIDALRRNSDRKR